MLFKSESCLPNDHNSMMMVLVQLMKPFLNYDQKTTNMLGNSYNVKKPLSGCLSQQENCYHSRVYLKINDQGRKKKCLPTRSFMN